MKITENALRKAIHGGLIDGARLESDLESEFNRTVDAIYESVEAALAATSQPVVSVGGIDVNDLAETTLVQLYPEVGEDGVPYLPHADSAENIERLIRSALAAAPQPDDEQRKCFICGQPFKLDDICATSINEGQCHAACLEWSPVVDLETGEPIPGGAVDTYPYRDIAGPQPVSANYASQPNGLTLSALQIAHIARQEEWCPDIKPDLSFRCNELGGECGEAQNVIKKLERERHGWRGSRDTVEHLGEELADVVHCAMLVAITAGIDLQKAVVDKFNDTSIKNGLSITLPEAAQVQDVLELEKEMKDLKHKLASAEGRAKNATSNCDYWTAQYEALKSAQVQDATAPEGWQLVPKEPTPEMIGAFWRQKNTGTQEIGLEGPHQDDYSAYRAMLAAAATAKPEVVAHPDDAAVDQFAAAMKAKLAKKRAEGRGGWDNPAECSVEWLSELLVRHIEKGDPIDVGNFAMMIHQRGGRIAK